MSASLLACIAGGIVGARRKLLSGKACGRQCGPVVRPLASRSGVPWFKTYSDHLLKLSFLLSHTYVCFNFIKLYLVKNFQTSSILIFPLFHNYYDNKYWTKNDES